MFRFRTPSALARIFLQPARILAGMISTSRSLRRLALVISIIVFVCTFDLYAAIFRASFRAAPPGEIAQQRPAPARRAPPDANPFHVEFRDVTAEAGIHFHHERALSPKRMYPETMGAGVAWIDYNQDGFLDAFFVNSGFTPLFHPAGAPQPALYRNNGDGTFTDVTASSKIHSDGTFLFGEAVGDYDNDGYPDIYITDYRHAA